MKIIDFERKGNVVRYYGGKDDCADYWGDGWDDCSYENNAGAVYDRFVSGYIDVAYPFDHLVLEPADTYYGESGRSKQDMIDCKVPCILVVPYSYKECSPHWASFCEYASSDFAHRIYFGDDLSVIFVEGAKVLKISGNVKF